MPLRNLLKPLSLIYEAVAAWRQNLYKRGKLRSFDLQLPTISVGNITVGGTGKTPLVAFIAEKLAEKGEKVCILTRGYGRENPKERVLVTDGENLFADSRTAGDEPFEIARKLMGKAVIIADAKRAEAGEWARENFGITKFILDDGFQHLRVRRDLDIVLIDATKPFEKAFVLPAGDLREPRENLQRADVIVISRANLVSESEIAELKKSILQFAPRVSVFVTKSKFTGIISLKSFGREKAKGFLPKIPLPNKAFAFCGLGNPESFYEQLKREGFSVVQTKSFADHHFYSQNEILRVEKEAIAAGAEILLTTAKDAAKLLHLNLNLPCYILESGLIFDDESAFVETFINLKKRI